MGNRAEALITYKKGVEVDPNNELLKKEMFNLDKEIRAQSMGGFPGMGGMPGGMGGMGGMPGGMGGMPGGMGGMPGGMGGMGGMGGPMGGMGNMFDENKLKQNPKIAKHFEDPQFCMKFQMAKSNPQMIIQLMQ